ncbi:MAG: SoxY-related AACIE arm protein [Burkholderiales bacterium]|nr:MAG: SoxY-related AACIE arm protein [Burkholderiales bacterium]
MTPPPPGPRRGALRSIVSIASLALLPPAGATPATLSAAIAAFTGGVAPTEGGMRLEVPELVENGNSVPLRVSVDSPMTEAAHVRRIAVFNEKNPQPQVAVFRLGPRSGVARVGTRMRMADSQRIVAVAELSDGSFRQHAVDVIVTLAACIETEGGG